mmetsp:Transcript_10518/g.23764  ORF Transcript_10518/g.23764 Transcript_10518/m.23764 type:complete len:126 (-) Transcript_10518:285-662(-)
MSSSFQHNNPITYTTNAVSDVIDDSSAATTTPMMIHAGTRVRIAGVVSQPTLNGREGCVVRVKNDVTTKMRDHTVERVLVAVDAPTKEEAQFVSVARAHVQPIRGNNDDVCRLLASKWSAEMTNN